MGLALLVVVRCCVSGACCFCIAVFVALLVVLTGIAYLALFFYVVFLSFRFLLLFDSNASPIISLWQPIA